MVGTKLKIMKKIFISLFFISGLLLVSCENEDTANVSKVTNYPLVSLLGSDPILVKKGTPFIDPGAKATEGANTIPFTVSALGKYKGGTSVDTNVIDGYNLSYTAVNVDGFTASATRGVWVYNNGDLVNSIEGLYTCTISRNGVTPSASYINIKYILIWKNANGSYEISDAFGGWYEYGRAIGVTSITPGGIINAVNIPTNTFTFPATLTNSYFGGTAKITDLKVNPATKKLVLTCVWDTAAPVTTYVFVATLTQVQP